MGDVCSNAASCSSLPQSTTPNPCVILGEKKVLVVFSSVRLMTLKHCGKIKIDTADDNLTFSSKRMFNVIEWEYFSEKLTFTPDTSYYDHKLFVDCSDLKGIELFNACTDPKSQSLFKSELVAELVFAVTQLKNYLLGLSKDYPKGGTIKLSVCAIHPVECLLFAFQKILGCSVEKENLYLDFFETVNKNPVLSNMKNWLQMDQHKWEVELEYCGVHRIYVEESQRRTPQGMKVQRKKEMEELRDKLKPVAQSLIASYNEWVSGHRETYDTDEMMKLNEKYNKEMDDWRSKGFILRSKWDNTINPMSGGAWTYFEPYLEFEGRGRSYQELEDMIKEQEEEEMAATEEALKPENIDKRKKEIDDTLELKKKEKNKELAELKERDKQIDDKLKELEKRNTDGSNESKEWSDRSVQLYNSSEEQKKNEKLIEFEGNLVTADQLKKEKDVSSAERKRASSEYWELRDKMVTEKQNLESLAKAIKDAESKDALDRVLTGIQLGLAVAGIALLIIVAAPVAAPVAAICGGLAATTTVASIGIEVVKWVKIDEGKNVGSHMASIVLDVISFKCLPIFKGTSRLITKNAAKQAEKLVSIEQSSLKKEIALAVDKDVTASKAQIKQWITTIDNGEDSALSLMKTINTKTLKSLDPKAVTDLNNLIQKAQKGKRGSRIAKTQDVRDKMQSIYESPVNDTILSKSTAAPKINRLSYLNDQAKMFAGLGKESLMASAAKGMNPVNWFKVQEGFSKTSSLSQGFAKFLGCEEEIAKIEKAFKITNVADAAGFYRNLMFFIYGGFDLIHYGRSILSSGFFYERDDNQNPNLKKK